MHTPVIFATLRQLIIVFRRNGCLCVAHQCACPFASIVAKNAPRLHRLRGRGPSCRIPLVNMTIHNYVQRICNCIFLCFASRFAFVRPCRSLFSCQTPRACPTGKLRCNYYLIYYQYRLLLLYQRILRLSIYWSSFSNRIGKRLFCIRPYFLFPRAMIEYKLCFKRLTEPYHTQKGRGP